MTYFVCSVFMEAIIDDDGYEWIGAGYRFTHLGNAETRGKAKHQYVQFLRRLNYDVKWTDKFSIRKIKYDFRS